jgi:hypothetical protein
MQILAFTGQGLLGLIYAATGAAKLAGAEQMKTDFRRFGYSPAFRIFTGLLEVTGAGMLVAGIFWPALAGWGGLLILAVMIGAVITHLRVNDPVSKMLPPFVLGLLALGVALVHGPL